MPGYRTKWCCVHTCALPDAILKHALSREYKAIDCPDLTNNTMRTRGASAHFCARVKGWHHVLGHRHRVRILSWLLEKRICVHINTRRVPYSGIVPDTRCARCPSYISSKAPTTSPLKTDCRPRGFHLLTGRGHIAKNIGRNFRNYVKAGWMQLWLVSFTSLRPF